MILMILSLLTLFLSFLACITDLRGLKIPNILPVFVAVLFVAYVVCGIWGGASYDSYFGNVIAGVSMFVLTFVLFSVGMFGAGDAKLVSALSFWVGLKGLPAFLFFMTAMGGILGFVALALIKYGVPSPLRKGCLKTLSKEKPSIPYAVAIFAGSIGGFVQSGLL